MLVAETYVGHRDDPSVAALLADADPHRVVLSDTDRRRSRVRTETEEGTDLGVVVGRVLADGDVLETEAGDLVVVALASVEALVVDFANCEVEAADAVALGHAAGNRHWDLALRDGDALFPASESHERMEATLADVLPADATVRYEAVPPSTFDDGETAASGHDHSNDHSHGEGAHSHSHGGAEDHTHTHEQGDNHSHAHGDHGHAHGDDHSHSHSHEGDEE